MSKVKSNYEIISDKTKNAVVNTEYVQHGTGWLDTVINSAVSLIDKKANKDYVDDCLALKANKSELESVKVRVSDNEVDINTLSARMDTFTNLEEGSTTGDAELADIRVGADGKTYADAGTSVRSQITDVKSTFNAKLGSVKVINKNKIPTSAINTVGSTLGGITYTPVFDTNGLKYISAVGTASANIDFRVCATAFGIALESGKNYILSGCPSGGGADKYRLLLQDSSYTVNAVDYGSGASFTANSNGNNVVIRIFSGNTVDLKFYPMIRLSGEDSTYVPYQYPVNIQSQIDEIASEVDANVPVDKISNDFPNVIDSLTIIKNKAILPEGGAESTAAGTTYSCTDYVEVSENETYKVYSGRGTDRVVTGLGSFYDSGKHYVAPLYATLRETEFTVPAGTKYVRFNLTNGDESSWSFKGKRINVKPLLVTVENLSDNIISKLIPKTSGKVGNILGDSNVAYNIMPRQLKSKLDLAELHNYGISGTKISYYGGGNENMCVRYQDMMYTLLASAPSDFTTSFANYYKKVLGDSGYVYNALTGPESFVADTYYKVNTESVDYIFVNGGTNDYAIGVPIGEITDTVNTTFYGALNNMIDGIQSAFPNAKLYLITPSIRKKAEYTAPAGIGANGKGFTLRNYADAIINAGKEKGVPVVDVFQNGNITLSNVLNYTSDGLHYNDNGGRRVAECVENVII